MCTPDIEPKVSSFVVVFPPRSLIARVASAVSRDPAAAAVEKDGPSVLTILICWLYSLHKMVRVGLTIKK